MTADHGPERHSSWWSTVRQALRGSDHTHSYTDGPLRQAVILLAIPMVMEMMMEGIFAVADIFYVSHLGADAVAVVGLTESMLAIIYALGMGLGTGVSAIVARRIGEENREGAAHAAAQGVILSAGVGLVLGVAGFIFAPELLLLMGASPEVVAVGGNFTRIMLGGEATIMLLFMLNAAFRGAGDPAITMRVLMISNGMNIVLAPVLIFVVGMGVTGAAVATTLARGLGAALAFRQLLGPNGRLPVRREHFRPDPAMLKSVVRMAGNVTFQYLVGTASWIGLTRIMATFGSEALAGYTVAMRVVIFAIMPAFGLASAAATLVGQSLGAKKPERAEAAVWTACRYSFVFLSLLGILFVVAAPLIVSAFNPDDQEMAGHAIRSLRIVAAGFPLYAFGMVITMSFNGAGDTWTPTWLNFFVFWLWEIPLAWVLAVPMGLGPDGPVIAIAIAFSTMAGVATVLFRRGHWKTRTV